MPGDQLAHACDLAAPARIRPSASKASAMVVGQSRLLRKFSTNRNISPSFTNRTFRRPIRPATLGRCKVAAAFPLAASAVRVVPDAETISVVTDPWAIG